VAVALCGDPYHYHRYDYFCLAQRTLAAFLAMDDLIFKESFLALAFPPFKPPNRPRMTAARCFSSAQLVVSFWLVADCTIEEAGRLMSECGFLLVRLGIPSVLGCLYLLSSPVHFKLTHYRGRATAFAHRGSLRGPPASHADRRARGIGASRCQGRNTPGGSHGRRSRRWSSQSGEVARRKARRSPSDPMQ